jgi:hypothetical protein
VITTLVTFALFKCLNLNTLIFPLQAQVYEQSFYEEHSELDPDEILSPGIIFGLGLGYKPVDKSIGRFVVK